MKSILNEGKKTAIDIRKEIMTLEEYKKKARDAREREAKSEKQLRLKERELEDEITSVTRKRRCDVEDTYKNQIDKSKAQLKKVADRRGKSKDAKMAERIKEDTAQFISDNRIINSDIKALMYKEKIPVMFKTDYALSIFIPKNPIDLLKLTIGFIVAFILLPIIIMMLTPWEEGIFLKIALFIGHILFYGGIYYIVKNTVVSTHTKLLNEIRNKKKEISSNKKKIKAITKGIKKEKDDSIYNLGKYDKEMENINDEIDDLVKEQKKALETFENSTKYMIENEIKSRYEKALIKLEDEHQQAKKDSDRLEDVVNKMTLDVSKKYDSYLGKDFLKVDKLDALIEIMEKGEAKTIGAAMEVYKSKYAI